MTHPYFSGARHPRVFAHRGLALSDDKDPSSSVWENTAAAFAAAHAVGAEYIETDCRLTADGDLVLFHDETLDRLFGDPRPVSAVRTRELAGLLAPHGGLLTVADALEAFPTSRFNIDVKSDEGAGPAGRAVAKHTSRVLLTSFSDARRRRAVAAALDAGAALRPAASGGRRTIASVRATSALRLPAMTALREVDALQIPLSAGVLPIFDGALVRSAHRHGAEVHVWTINDAATMTRLVTAGADGIVTDRADVAIEVLAPQ
ncbi:glycerophosphodiester phosphodiesterase family protein [Microbacterium sp. NPDC055903]